MHRIAFIVAIAIVALAGPRAGAGAVQHQDGLVLPDAAPWEQQYRRLARKWLEWAMALPWSTGPVNDPTGAACDLGQHGSVWFLAGTTGGAATRTCEISTSDALFVPLLNTWVIPPAEFADTPEEQADLLAFVPLYFAETRGVTCELTLRLDGEELLADTAARDAALYVAIEEPFPIYLNEADNFQTPWGFPGGELPMAFVAGHWALLAPLSPGEHVLEVGGAQCDAAGPIFETSVTYHLTVTE